MNETISEQKTISASAALTYRFQAATEDEAYQKLKEGLQKDFPGITEDTLYQLIDLFDFEENKE